MRGAYLGPTFTQAEIEQRLTSCGAVFETVREEEMIEQTTQALAEGKAVGWFQGRMEFGPRALGGRSILGDPRSETMQKTLNLKVKFRESFRPFAPSVCGRMSPPGSSWRRTVLTCFWSPGCNRRSAGKCLLKKKLCLGLKS